MKLTSFIAGAALLVLLSPEVGAQELPRRGNVALAVDRVFGFTRSSRTTEEDVTNAEVEVTTGTVAFLGQRESPSPYSSPRFSFDYFLTDGLSIGGSLFFWSASRETDPGNVEVNRSEFLIAPRVGYAFMFSNAVGMWPRGGLTFSTLSGDVSGIPGEVSERAIALSLDVPFVFSPAPHFAILFGPAFDIGAGGGSYEAGPVEVDYDLTAVDIALHTGLVGWF